MTSAGAAVSVLVATGLLAGAVTYATAETPNRTRPAAHAPTPTRADRLAAQLTAERRAWKQERRELRQAVSARWQPTVQHAIALAAATYRVDRRLLDRISYCESTYRPTARNGRYVGLAQFGLPLWNSTAYWSFDRADAYGSALGLAEKIREGGLSHWYASRHCWGGR